MKISPRFLVFLISLVPGTAVSPISASSCPRLLGVWLSLARHEVVALTPAELLKPEFQFFQPPALQLLHLSLRGP